MWKWIMQRPLPAAFWLSGPLTQMEEFLQLAEKTKSNKKIEFILVQLQIALWPLINQ